MADIPPYQPAPPAGTDCEDCDGILWPSGSTPSAVLAVFRDMSPCPGYPNPPNNKVFVLNQHPLYPCSWWAIQKFALWDWAVDWDADTGYLLLRYWQLLPTAAFEYTMGPCKWHAWQNDRPCPGSAASGGSAVVVPVNNAVCQVLAQLYALDPNTPAFYNAIASGIDHCNFNLRVTPGFTRCKIQLDDEDLPNPWPIS